MEKTIVLSAGHSLKDPGAISPFDRNITESQLVMKITKKAAEILRLHSVAVLEVPDDLDLKATINWVNSRPNEIDVAVEIHINTSSDQAANGVEGWHYTKNEPSKKLSQWIVDGIMVETGLFNRGVKDETTNRWGILGFVHNTKPLACLIECGFISSKKDMAVLGTDEGQFNVAKGIARGILGYLNINWNPVLLAPVPPEVPEVPVDPEPAAPVLNELLDQAKKDLKEEKNKVAALQKKQEAALATMREYKDVLALLGSSIEKAITELES